MIQQVQGVRITTKQHIKQHTQQQQQQHHQQQIVQFCKTLKRKPDENIVIKIFGFLLVL